MGYPMTYQRVIRRNHVAEGGYGDKRAGLGWLNTEPYTGTAADFTQAPDDFDFTEHLRKHLNDTLGALRIEYDRWAMLMGDLRRLERDSQDEEAVCSRIARQTGVDPEVVAAVLQAWIHA